MKNKKICISKRVTIILFIIFFLLGVVGVSYLLQQKAILRSKAETPSCINYGAPVLDGTPFPTRSCGSPIEEVEECGLNGDNRRTFKVECINEKTFGNNSCGFKCKNNSGVFVSECDQDSTCLSMPIAPQIIVSSVTSEPKFANMQPPPTAEQKTLTIQQRKLLLADSNFFITPQDTSGRKIISPQFGPSEWKRLYIPLPSSYERTACGPAVITQIIKAMHFFRNGQVPDITIADVANFLMDKKHEGALIIYPGHLLMEDNRLLWALDLWGKETGLFTTVNLRPLSPDSFSHIIEKSEWVPLFANAKKMVLDKGGILVAQVFKYGNPPGTLGHFMIISSIDDLGRLLIVDSIGPNSKGGAGWSFMQDYAEPVAEGNAQGQRYAEAGKSSFVWLTGVIPTF